MTLQSDLGIESSAGLKDMLAAHVDVDAPIAVDGAGVQRVHTASLQVLAAWWQARTLHARETRWADIGEPLRAAARTTPGVAAQRGAWEAAVATGELDATEAAEKVLQALRSDWCDTP